MELPGKEKEVRGKKRDGQQRKRERKRWEWKEWEKLPLGEYLILPIIKVEIGQPSLSYKRRKRARKDILRKPKTR